MPSTPEQAFPYPALSDPANGPVAIQNLALELEKRTVFVRTSSTMPPHLEGRVVYKTDTDRLAISDGATWIDYAPQAAVDAIQNGQIGVTVSASDNGSATLTFPTAYAAAPSVVVSAMNSFYVATVTAITTTQATIAVRQVNAASASATIQVQWIAVP